MSAERKVSHKVYMAWEFDEEEQHLDEMSRQGWQVVKGGCFHTVYEKAPDKRYRHRIDYNSRVLKDPEEKKLYFRTFEEAGWEHAGTTFNGWIFWKKEVKPGIPEEEYQIYTDRQSLTEMFRRWRILGIGCVSVTLVLGIAYLVMGIVSALTRPALYSLPYILFGILLLVFGRTIDSGIKTLRRKMEEEKDPYAKD